MLAGTRRGLGVLELAEKTGLNGSTVHRLLGTLLEQGYVRQDTGSKKYLLGPQSLRLGYAALSHFDIRNDSLDLLRELAENVQELANLALLTGNEATYVAQVPTPGPVQMFTQFGSRVPLHCTGVGKAILAYLPEKEVHKLLDADRSSFSSFTKNTITSLAAMEIELQTIRKRGYAVDNEEREIGVRCVAAPVFGPGGNVVGAVSVSGPSARVSAEREPEFANYVMASAREISERLGYSHSAPPRTATDMSATCPSGDGSRDR